MLEVVILALLVNGYQGIRVEKYNPNWLKTFDNNPSDDLFPEIDHHRRSMDLDVSVSPKNVNGLEFRPRIDHNSGFHFVTKRGAEMILTSLLFEFFDNGKCTLKLTFETVPPTLDWIVTSPVYSTPEIENCSHARNYAVSPSQSLTFGTVSLVRSTKRFTSFNGEWVERVIHQRRRRGRCYGGTSTEIHCAGVAVVLQEDVLNLMQEKIGELKT